MENLVPERNKFGENHDRCTEKKKTKKKTRELGENGVADFMDIL